MKKNILVTGIILATAIAGFYSCKRDIAIKSPVSTTSGMAMLHIIDASPGFRKLYNLPDTFNVFLNGVKLSGYTPGAGVTLTYNNSFPTASSGYGYAAVAPGTQTIKLSVAGVVNPDSIPIQSFTKTLLANQQYTFIITDSIASARDSAQIFVQDTYVQPTSGYFNLRFIHAVWNDTAGKAIDVWSTRANRTIFSNIKPGTTTAFSAYPYNAVYSDTFYVRRYGTLQGLDTFNTVSFSNQRSYTLYYKGDGTLSYSNKTSSPAKARHLATYVNQ